MFWNQLFIDGILMLPRGWVNIPVTFWIKYSCYAIKRFIPQLGLFWTPCTPSNVFKLSWPLPNNDFLKIGVCLNDNFIVGAKSLFAEPFLQVLENSRWGLNDEIVIRWPSLFSFAIVTTHVYHFFLEESWPLLFCLTLVRRCILANYWWSFW